MNRRNFLSLSGALLASGLPPLPQPTSKPRAILFDSFPIFDPAPVAALTTQFFPHQAPNLLNTWRTRQFEYTWLRSLTREYTDFETITSDALDYAAAALQLSINPEQHQQLIDTYHHLNVWPEVPAVLTQLKEKGYRLGFLSNFTPEMLKNNTRNNAINHHFEHLISVDRIKTYKPAPQTYQLAADTFQLAKEEILFVPFAGWDAAGAKSFGYKTFWVNRGKTPPERLGHTPDGEGPDLHHLIEWLAIK